MKSSSAYQEQLNQCYSEQAKHFSHSRKKFWPELDYIKQSIQQIQKQQPIKNIVELGCGDGRLYGILNTMIEKSTVYTGIDSAS